MIERLGIKLQVKLKGKQLNEFLKISLMVSKFISFIEIYLFIINRLIKFSAVYDKQKI